MDAVVKQDWVKALESGEYEQGHGYLNNHGKYCCLGVLCDLAEKAGVVKTDNSGNKGKVWYEAVSDPYDENTLVLPDAVMEWAGLDSKNPIVQVDGESKSLADVNDDGEPFSVIARIIDDQL